MSYTNLAMMASEYSVLTIQKRVLVKPVRRWMNSVFPHINDTTNMIDFDTNLHADTSSTDGQCLFMFHKPII